MEDDELEYHVTFPSPSPGPGDGDFDKGQLSRDGEEKPSETVVIIVGWYGSCDKDLSTYSSIYERPDLGCITVRYSPSPAAIHCPGRQRVLASKLLALLTDLDLETSEVMFHLLGSGGSSLYQHVHSLIYTPEYLHVRLAGAIFDSCPSKDRIANLYHEEKLRYYFNMAHSLPPSSSEATPNLSDDSNSKVAAKYSATTQGSGVRRRRHESFGGTSEDEGETTIEEKQRRVMAAVKAVTRESHSEGLKSTMGSFMVFVFVTMLLVRRWLVSLLYGELDIFGFEGRGGDNDESGGSWLGTHGRLKCASGRWPELYLYSAGDCTARAGDIEEVVEHRRHLVDVSRRRWEETRHVGHLDGYPRMYRQECVSFLKKCTVDEEEEGGEEGTK